MKELYVFCEGPTEQAFCRQVLSPHLFPDCHGCIHTIRVAHKQHHGVTQRGGVVKYAPLRRDIQNTLRSRGEPKVFFTSFIDLYGLPADFPGVSTSTRNPADPTPHVLAVEAAFGEDIDDPRFIPHLQLHEYETLLFSDPDAFRISFDDCETAVNALREIASAFPSVEHINDGRSTAPSKRIINVLPEYKGRKPDAGPDIAEFIGISALRAKCAHFDRWLLRLEGLPWDDA